MLINNIRKSPTFPIRNTIHAPTRGATLIHFYMHYRIFISIHAPTRGATQNCFTQQSQEQNFNPRSYKRSDCFLQQSVSLFLNISIYAPTRGATDVEEAINKYLNYFNPRSYKRSDLLSAPAHIRPLNFNPRSYKRSDDLHLSMWYCILQFQSTLLQEERQDGAT